MKQPIKTELSSSPPEPLGRPATTCRHRSKVAAAQRLLDAFLGILQQVPPSPRNANHYMLSIDLYSTFERFAVMDLPSGFQREMGRRISKACSAGTLPFTPGVKTGARLAAVVGLDRAQLAALLS
jgi:hypothetical protein